MNWYYAKEGKQEGPFNEAEFQNFVAQGIIQPHMLVWREGLPAWTAWSTLAPPLDPATAAPPVLGETPSGSTTVVCAHCGQRFLPDQVLQLGQQYVCVTCKPLYVQKLREGAVLPSVTMTAVEPTTLRYGGFWIRLAALLIDWVILFVVTFPISMIMGSAQPFLFSMNRPPTETEFAAFIGAQIGAVLVNTVINLLYNWLFVGKYGATPGKMLLGLKIVRADGRPISYGRAFGRFWAHILSALPCYIGYLMAAFDDQKRALHDHVCDTRVIYR